MLAAREALMRSLHLKADDSIIEQVLRTGSADVDEKVVSVIRDTATDYVAGIMRSLREDEVPIVHSRSETSKSDEM